jgi:acetyltransferase
MVTDAFQKRGLGTVLTKACVVAARQWGMREVHGTVARDNAPMIALFRDCGFELESAAQTDRLRAYQRLT